MNLPILLLIWNREAHLESVISPLRLIKPSHIYISCDGPTSSPSSVRSVLSTRKTILRLIDWPCIVRTNFYSTNLGCKQAVSSGISWFFTHVDFGLIIEDDVVIDPSFYYFCLSAYKQHDLPPSISAISASAYSYSTLPPSSHLSIFVHVWGWATWRKTWDLYSEHLCVEDLETLYLDLRDMYGSVFSSFWHRVFTSVAKGEIDTWDYQLQYTLFKHKLYCLIPPSNLSTNLGVGHASTHTSTLSFKQPAIIPLSNTEFSYYPLTTSPLRDLLTFRTNFFLPIYNRLLFKIQALLHSLPF